MALPAALRHAARWAAEAAPDGAVAVLPGPLQDRVQAIREQVQAEARERSYLPPDGISRLDNVAYNRQIWDWYADRWADPEFRRRQLAHEGRPGDDPSALEVLGEEWGRLEDARQVITEWVLPFVSPEADVAEIGTGGGRIARMVAPHVGRFTAFDLSDRMLTRVRAALADVPAATDFELLDGTGLPAACTDRFDFVYAFDVFVHLDLHTQWRYLQEIHRVLRPGGRALVHTADLTTGPGWERFAAQAWYRVEGFYFMTPQAVRTLACRAGLTVERERSGGDGSNFYYDRDHLALLAKDR